jgi:hypothetical protein
MARSEKPVVKSKPIPGEPKGWRPVENPIPRFLSKVECLENGCWQWTAATYRGGYGAFGVGSELQGYAHRWSYVFFVGNIPERHVLDHLCRNPGCVNPDHLEAVPQRVNHMRGRNPEVTRARYQAQTHCRRGHPFDEENTYRHPNGRRVCRTCFREYDRLWARAKRAGLPTRGSIAGYHEPRTAAPKPSEKSPADLKERFLGKLEKNASGCWDWTAGRFPTGYGKFRVGRTGTSYAHRWAYLLFVGHIPVGKEIDHLCRNRACVNPEHLEAVSRRENALRGAAPDNNRARAAARTHCPCGHPYSSENTYHHPAGYRACRTCNREAQRPYLERKKAREATP